MERLREFIKSIMGGVCIALGAFAYLMCENIYVGSVLFCIGLISILIIGFNLYTGKIGYVLNEDNKFRIDTLLSIFGNMIGVFIFALPRPLEHSVALVEEKLQNGLLLTLFNAIGCGLLIYLCVEIYKRKNTLIGVLIAVPTFIICGFEHSIADMFYLFNARVFSLKAVLFIAVVIIGNAVGALIIPTLSKIGVVKSKAE